MFEKELEVATILALEAGELVMEIYATDFEVAYKGKANPVTEADHRANDCIVRGLTRAFPTDGIVAEENADHSDAYRGGRCWFVDPLDGTKEFIKKNGEFSMMIGLAIDGVAKVGVVFQPATGKLYRGAIGSPATLRVNGETTSLRVSEESDPAQLRLVVSRSHRDEATDRLVQQLHISNENKSGSVGLKVGLIAEREADLYVHFSDKASKWDVCAPEAILHAAGGRVTMLNGKAQNYAVRDMKNHGGILACNAAAFDVVAPIAFETARTAGLVFPD